MSNLSINYGKLTRNPLFTTNHLSIKMSRRDWTGHLSLYNRDSVQVLHAYFYKKAKKPTPFIGVNEGKFTTFTTSQTEGHRRAGRLD
jgi:hypothetical protein